MRRGSAIALCTGSLILLTVALAVEWYPLPDASERLAQIPREGPGFHAQDIPLTELEQTQLGKAQAVKLLVRNDDGTAFLYSAIDGTRNRHAVHDPEYCFRGAGWQSIHEETLELPGGAVQKVTLERDGVRREALYWYGNTEVKFVSPERYWWEATLRRLSFGLSSDEPVLYVIQGLSAGAFPAPSADSVPLPPTLEPWLN